MPHDTPQRENLNAPPKLLEEVFRMQKGNRVAVCRLWTHAFGWELRLFVGEQMLSTQVVRNDAEIEAFTAKWREALESKGWVT